MTTQLLIYQAPVPVSQAAHGNWSVEVGTNYAFSAGVNAVPLMAVEFPQAALEYAIVFAGPEGDMMPTAILGVRNGQNLYVARNGRWRANYIPAFVRRYPFVFSNSPDGYMLNMDEAFSGFNQEGRGERLFDDAGKQTPFVDRMMQFLNEYQGQFALTQLFCRRLQELDVLEATQVQVTTASGESVSVGGFSAVNRAKLKSLPVEVLNELLQSDQLEVLYLHLHSIRNFDRLRHQLELTIAEGG